MEELQKQIERLMPEPENAIKLWLRGKEIAKRIDIKGTVDGHGKLISIVALTRAATRYLSQTNSTRIALEEICKTELGIDNGTNFPWGPCGADKLTGPYNAGRVLCDLDNWIGFLAGKDLTKKALTSLETWLGSEELWTDAINLPFIYRAANALHKHSSLEPELASRLGLHAQALIDRYISRHCLGSRSQFDQVFLCLAIVMDSAFSANPLSRGERTRCLEIVSECEPLVVSSRSTTTRKGIGCSAIEILLLLMRSGLLHGDFQKKQLEEAIAWLEDHSALVTSPSLPQVRCFRSDLWPTHQKYEVWFNAITLEFLKEAQLLLNEDRQRTLQARYLASEPTVELEYAKLICGGFKWPAIIKDRMLKKVAEMGTTTEQTGNGIVLFGPPGTGKTTIAKMIAKELTDWHFIKLAAADFLADGHDDLFKTIRRIFYDLKRLCKCVVFFDELEILVLERDTAHVNWDTALLTAIMLPELQELHDCPKVIPIFATNFISRFDKAGRRPGRFDYVLPVGPPSVLERKQLIQSSLPPDLFFDGIEAIPEGGTIREIKDWANEYKEQNVKDCDTALSLWTRGFKLLRIDAELMTRFTEDIGRFTYPFDII